MPAENIGFLRYFPAVGFANWDLLQQDHLSYILRKEIHKNWTTQEKYLETKNNKKLSLLFWLPAVTLSPLRNWKFFPSLFSLFLLENHGMTPSSGFIPSHGEWDLISLCALLEIHEQHMAGFCWSTSLPPPHLHSQETQRVSKCCQLENWENSQEFWFSQRPRDVILIFNSGCLCQIEPPGGMITSGYRRKGAAKIARKGNPDNFWLFRRIRKPDKTKNGGRTLGNGKLRSGKAGSKNHRGAYLIWELTWRRESTGKRKDSTDRKSVV